jgi:hypothetical protein
MLLEGCGTFEQWLITEMVEAVVIYRKARATLVRRRVLGHAHGLNVGMFVADFKLTL